MSLDEITDIDQLKKIINALMRRVESAMDQQGNAFSLFQTAIQLEGQVKRRTDELTIALRQFEKTNIELETAKEASEIANLSKTRFLAAASHDILQPLNAALLSISVLYDMQENDAGKNLVQQIERSLDTMNELLNTLLDMSKLDAGVVTPKFEQFPLWQILEGIQSDFLPIADEKKLQLRFRCEDTLAVFSDRTMLRRIFQNLVSNALRYTQKGGVLIAVKKRENALYVSVIDTGQGIPQDQQLHVFEEFNRGALPSGHDRTANSGLGLGLSIVERMTSALNHELTMTSKLHKGTRFTLKVPRADNIEKKEVLTVKAPTHITHSNLQGTKILCIENDPAGTNAMKLLLGKWQCDARFSTSTKHCLNLLNDTDWVPDIIIADQHLDHGDLGTLAIQSARHFTGHNIPAIIITADATKTLETKIKTMQMALMHKPIKPAPLRALLNHIIMEQQGHKI